MARSAQTKAERRQARAGQPTKAERRQTREEHKREATQRRPAARRQAEGRRGEGTDEKAADGEAAAAKATSEKAATEKAAEEKAAADGSPEEGIQQRLARLEQAVADQSERGDELLTRVTQAKEAIRAAERPPTSQPDGGLDAEMAEGIKLALRMRRENAMPVDQPLALICQAQRSGGTLLARLFDGHPQCHAHPHELHIGDKRPHIWPELELDQKPETWFARLQEEKLVDLFGKGKRRIPLKGQDARAGESLYPFLLPPAYQRRIFLDEIKRRGPITSERQILDSYMTSLFNGWLDNQHLRGREKRWVIAFSPRRAWGERLDKHFELYPDGRLISILRDPLSWYSSAQGRDPEADPEKLVEHWKRSVGEMLEADRRFGERFCVVRFDELVLDTAGTMRRLTEFLEIDFDPQVTTPTFNGYPVGANSSYEVRSTGVVADPVDRHKELLSDEQREMVGGQCDELYEQALALIERRAAPGAAAREEPISLATATIGQLTRSRGSAGSRRGEIIEFRDRRDGVDLDRRARSGQPRRAGNDEGPARPARALDAGPERHEDRRAAALTRRLDRLPG